MTEADIQKNFLKVFDYEADKVDVPTCDYFAKLLYLYMSRGFERYKISLHRFLQSLYLLCDNENKQHHNKVAFQILDLDHDRELNILNLMDLHQHLNPRTKIGQEVFKLVKWYMETNIKNMKGSSKFQELNLDQFSKIVGRSCIVEEIRDSIFQAYIESPEPMSRVPMRHDSSANVMGAARQRQREIDEKRHERNTTCIFKVDESIKFEYGYYRNDIKMLDDVSYGQRDYYQNLEVVYDKLMSEWEHRKKLNFAT